MTSLKRFRSLKCARTSIIRSSRKRRVLEQLLRQPHGWRKGPCVTHAVAMRTLALIRERSLWTYTIHTLTHSHVRYIVYYTSLSLTLSLIHPINYSNIDTFINIHSLTRSLEYAKTNERKHSWLHFITYIHSMYYTHDRFLWLWSKFIERNLWSQNRWSLIYLIIWRRGNEKGV